MFCGFNDDMFEGLRLFHKGLIEHGILERSKNKKQSLETTIKKELDEMRRFQKKVYLIKDPRIQELTKTLTDYVISFYEFMGERGVNNYRDLIKKINDYFFEMDRKFYSELEGQPDDMRKLAEYLNKIEI